MARWFQALLVVAIAGFLATAPGYADEKKKSDPDKEKKEAPGGEQGFLGVNLAGGGEEEGGAVVDSVTDDGPAAKAGVKGGDKIIKLNDKDVKNGMELAEQVRGMKPGQTVTVTLKRDNKEMKIKVTLGKRTED